MVVLKVWLWEVATGRLETKVSHSGEDSLTCASWAPDGRRLAVVSKEKCREGSSIVESYTHHSHREATGASCISVTLMAQFSTGSHQISSPFSLSIHNPSSWQIIFPTEHSQSSSWEGVRVQCLAYRADGRHILAADTHHRVRLIQSPTSFSYISYIFQVV